MAYKLAFCSKKSLFQPDKGILLQCFVLPIFLFYIGGNALELLRQNQPDQILLQIDRYLCTLRAIVTAGELSKQSTRGRGVPTGREHDQLFPSTGRERYHSTRIFT